MLFDVFLCVVPIPIDDKCPSEWEMWRNAFDMIQLADELGFGVAWFGESHLSHLAQMQNSTPACPSFKSEISLNSDFVQLAARVLSITKNIGVGSASLNILCNGGPVANAERIAQLVSMHVALSNSPKRNIHVAFSAGRFEYARRGFGILPRNELEVMVWEELQPLIFQEAMEVFLRLLRGDVLRSDHLTPCVLSSNQVTDQEKWFTLIRALKQCEELETLEKKNQDVQKVKSKLTWCMDVRRINDHQVKFPFRFVYPEQHIGVISKPLDASCLHLLLGSHDPFMQRLANKWLPVQVTNLSVTASKVIEQTHELMEQVYHPSGGKWKREYMPQTVLVFVNADSHLTQAEQNEAAYRVAISALKEYWKAVEGTILDENSPAHDLRNAVWGSPSQIASQLRNKYHPQDRLMLWFDFFNYDLVAVCRSMRIFMELVAPLMQDGRALHLSQPEWTVTNYLNGLQHDETYDQSTSDNRPNLSVTVRREIVFVIDLVLPTEGVNEAQWTSEWLKTSSPGIETQIFNGIDACWPTEFELTGCLGVVITGSNCSCLNDYSHTEPLFDFFKTLIRLEISVLAICYSAQMLVRWLSGKENVMRLPEPHVGFIHIELLANRGLGRHFPLFNDVVNEFLISSSAQCDGLILPNELRRFSVEVGSTMQEIRFVDGASTTKLKHQAFQLLGLPVWGIQFHPNWSADEAETIFQILKSHHPNLKVERQGTVDEDARHQVARGFLSACRQHLMLKWIINIQMFGLTNLSTPSYVAQKDEPVASSDKHVQEVQFKSNGFARSGCISLSGSVMGMAYRVSVAPRTPHHLNLESELATAIQVVFDKVNMVVNNWNSESEISKLVKNFQNGAESAILSPLLARICRVAFEAHQVTDKSFDPTVGGIKKFLKSSGRLSASDMEAASAAVGLSRWYSLRVGDHSSPAQLHRVQYKTGHAKAFVDFDLCSIAKGFAVDLLCDALQDMKIEDYCVEWAGEIRIRGLDPSRNPWTTTIVRTLLPDESFNRAESLFGMSYDNLVFAEDITPMGHDSSESMPIAAKKHRLGTLPIDCQWEPLLLNKKSSFVVDVIPQYASQNISLATSGTWYETLGDNLSHIINPMTLQPVSVAADSPVCVTIILGSTKAPAGNARVSSDVNDIGAWADVLATAAMVESSVFDCAEFLWNISNRMNNSPLPSQYSLLDFYITSKDGRTFGKSSVTDRLSLQTNRLLTSLPQPVCVLAVKVPFGLTFACVCTSAFATVEGTFFVSLITQNRLCRLLVNGGGCSLTELTAYFLFPAQKDLVRSMNDRSNSSVLSPEIFQKLEQGASRIVRVQLTAYHTVGDHIVFLGSCFKQEFHSARILCYAKKHYFESQMETISGSLPQTACTLTHSHVSFTSPLNVKNRLMTMAMGVCSSKPPVMYVVTSTEEILLGEVLALDCGFNLKDGYELVSSATSAAVPATTPSVRVTGVVSKIIPLAKFDSVLVMMDVVDVSATVMSPDTLSSNV